MITNALSEFKKQFEGRRGIHLNNAGISPICEAAAVRAREITREQIEDAQFATHAWAASVPVVREKLARFLGAAVDDVAFIQNCGTALSQVALGFPLTSSDTVVTIDQEYASNFYPWQEGARRAGAKFVVIQSSEDLSVPVERILNAIQPGVKLVGISWVQFQSGTVQDLQVIGERCHSVGAFLCVDGIQGLGQLPFNFNSLPVDFITGAVHKWMCSYMGVGFFAVKKNLRDLLDPTAVGCSTFNRFSDFGDPNALMETSARKFETGGFPLAQMMILIETLTQFEKVGMQEIANEIARHSSRIRFGLKEMGVRLLSPVGQLGGITGFALPSASEARLFKICDDRRISIAKRGAAVRVSPHAFNSDEDISQLLTAIKDSL